MQIEQLYNIYKQFPSVQTDTRKLRPGDLFFALKGDNFNGNEFAAAALQAGAAYVVIDDSRYAAGDRTVLVADALKALQDLAGYHREQLNIPVLAITGSNGKTTTKELVHAVLSTKYRTSTTEGNLNNHIGIPLTLLRVPADTEIAVIEMGANHVGEIAGYCTYTNPTHGLITNAGKAHLEGFGGPEGVRRGKGELFDHLRGLTPGFAFVNWDYDYLHDMSKGISGIIKYGTGEDVFVCGEVKQSDPLLEVSFRQGFSLASIQTKLVGAYNLPNVLAAVTIGKFFEVPEENIRQALEGYTPSNSRSQLVQLGSNRLIMDAYNANPSSMRLAIENLAASSGGRGVLILGAMAELGEHSLEEHRQLVELIDASGWQAVALVGGDFQKLPHNYLRFESAGEAREWFAGQQFEDSVILVKGSRSAGMEKVIG